MPTYSGCTIETIEAYHSPNVGRRIINDNFECIANDFNYTLSASNSAHTVVDGGTNISETSVVDGQGVTTYTVNLDDDIIVDSISASTVSGDTFYSAGTELSQLFVSTPSVSVTNAVSATGDTTTIGTGSPTLSAYTFGEIYVTTFDTANTGTGTTIDIDGIGQYNIEKYNNDLSGFTQLDIGDIQPTVQYFLTFDNARFQFNETNPDSAAGTYTTPYPIPTAHGGVDAGTTFTNTPISDVFNDVFYPFLSPRFTSFKINGQSTLLEVGDTVAAGSKSFRWTYTNGTFIKPNTTIIRDVTNATILANGINYNTSPTAITISSVQKIVPSQHRWQIRSTRTNNSVFARNFNINWRWRVFYGTSSATTLTSAQITGLTSSNPETSIINDTWAYGSGDYKYLCIPSTFTSPTLFKDTSTNLSIAMADTAEGYSAGTGTHKYFELTVTNQFFISQTYRVYRTRNSLGGSINIKTT